ncbi:MAG: hypothetical protein LC541_14900 [Candidatus Thiodiazotropha sp.]|nr:hypothetical protein [Candidatus Thiodiazotropha sp.]MCM8884558.1 hypothetical protein [Candidatus Thiodiazotropha sp.]
MGTSQHGAGGGGGGGFAYGVFKNTHRGQSVALGNIAFTSGGSRNGVNVMTTLGLSAMGGLGASEGHRDGGRGGPGSVDVAYPGLFCLSYDGGAGGNGPFEPPGDKRQMIHAVTGGGGGAGSFFGDGGAGGTVQGGNHLIRETGLITVGACGGGGFGGSGGVWYADNMCYGGGGVFDTHMEDKKKTFPTRDALQSFFGPGGGGSAGPGYPADSVQGGKGGAANDGPLISPFLAMARKQFRGYGGDGWGPGRMPTHGGPGGGGGGGGSIEGKIAAPGGQGGFGGGGGGSPLMIELTADAHHQAATLITSRNLPLYAGGHGGFGGGGGGGAIGGHGGLGGGGGGGSISFDGKSLSAPGGQGGQAVALVYW